jgi:stearoyl-CoA desaturase (delta-9 desaturase)
LLIATARTLATVFEQRRFVGRDLHGVKALATLRAHHESGVIENTSPNADADVRRGVCSDVRSGERSGERSDVRRGVLPRIVGNILCWFDSGTTAAPVNQAMATEKAATQEWEKVDWTRILPFIVMHLICFSVIWVGWSPVAVITAVALYVLRMFAITAFYHRYFSHRSFKTSRVGQFVFGVLGASAVQRGPVWWAAHHRHHHAHSDKPADVHSPVQHGFIRAHMGWFLSKKGFTPDLKCVRDLMKFPELRLLDRFDILVPVAFAAAIFFVGVTLKHTMPELGTSGWQMLVWGFFISTIACYHGTYTINSLSHVFGKQRYRTGDQSRNNWFLALITLGEGWHNNHHHYPSSARQGFYWWEVDLTWYALKMMSWLGIIWDLRAVPVSARDHSVRRIRRMP